MGAILGKVNEEVPKHVVVHRAADYEIWRYPAQVAAVVYARDVPPETPGAPAPRDDKFTRLAFWMLARYIGVVSAPENGDGAGGGDAAAGEKVAMTAPVVMTGGAGAAPEKIAMTAPVVMTSADGGASAPMSDEDQCMKFLLPSKYTCVADAPAPTNPAVKLELVPAGRCEAVLPFSGFFNMGIARGKADVLTAALERDGVSITGQWSFQGYNSPFVIPWLRRNELHVPVDPQPYLDIEEVPAE